MSEERETMEDRALRAREAQEKLFRRLSLFLAQVQYGSFKITKQDRQLIIEEARNEKIIL